MDVIQDHDNKRGNTWFFKSIVQVEGPCDLSASYLSKTFDVTQIMGYERLSIVSVSISTALPQNNILEVHGFVAGDSIRHGTMINWLRDRSNFHRTEWKRIAGDRSKSDIIKAFLHESDLCPPGQSYTLPRRTKIAFV